VIDIFLGYGSEAKNKQLVMPDPDPSHFIFSLALLVGEVATLYHSMILK
jgi:hypothetical protein